jgi:hypothetical protein
MCLVSQIGWTEPAAGAEAASMLMTGRISESASGAAGAYTSIRTPIFRQLLAKARRASRRREDWHRLHVAASAFRAHKVTVLRHVESGSVSVCNQEGLRNLK